MDWHDLFCLIGQLVGINTVLPMQSQLSPKSPYDLHGNKGDRNSTIQRTWTQQTSVWDCMADSVNTPLGICITDNWHFSSVTISAWLDWRWGAWTMLMLRAQLGKALHWEPQQPIWVSPQWALCPCVLAEFQHGNHIIPAQMSSVFSKTYSIACSC